MRDRRARLRTCRRSGCFADPARSSRRRIAITIYRQCHLMPAPNSNARTIRAAAGFQSTGDVDRDTHLALVAAWYIPRIMIVDLRSASQAMREAMAAAPVGDDAY